MHGGAFGRSFDMANDPQVHRGVIPYLVVSDPAAALDFYRAAFGAQEVLRLTIGDKVGHAEMLIGGARVMMSGEWPDMGMLGPNARGGQPGAMGDGMAGMMEMMRPMMAGGGAMGMPYEHVEGRIAYLKAEMKITEVQAAPWNTFADAMRADAAAMKAMHEGMAQGGMMTGGTTQGAMPAALPDRFAAQRKMMTGRVAMLDRMEAGAAPLYAVLSADQRRVMDQAMAGPMGMM